MNPSSQEWFDKAENDYRVAMRERKVKDGPSYDAVCFHSQQCIEKYLKGFLRLHELPSSKTHELSILLDSCLDLQPFWESWRMSFDFLTSFAVEFRYPGEWVVEKAANRAFSICDSFRKEIRTILSENGIEF